jgi:hypothetical protein
MGCVETLTLQGSPGASATVAHRLYRRSPDWKEEMARKPTLSPGDPTPRSGQYEIVGPRGGHTGKERTSTRGNPLPPTPEAGQGYRLVDPTKH